MNEVTTAVCIVFYLNRTPRQLQSVMEYKAAASQRDAIQSGSVRSTNPNLSKPSFARRKFVPWDRAQARMTKFQCAASHGSAQII